MKGKSKVPSGGIRLFDSGAEERALKFLQINCSNVNSYSSAPESNKQNMPDRTTGLPFIFQHKQITSLKNLPSPAPNESLSYWFQGHFAAMSVLSCLLREFFVSIR